MLVAELDFERLLQAREPLLTVQTPSRFPPADRDIAIVVDEDAPHATSKPRFAQRRGRCSKACSCSTCTAGESIPAGRKSLAFRIALPGADRTLEEDEVAAVHARVEEALRARFRAEVRGR